MSPKIACLIRRIVTKIAFFFTFVYCVILDVYLNYLFDNMQSYTDCICLNFLQCVFLKKKLNASTAISPQSEQASTKEAEVLRKAPPVLHHHPSSPASSERRQAVVVEREKAMLSFNQLNGSASPHCPPRPPLTSCTASTQTWFGSTNKFCMAKTHSIYSGPDLKWNATNAM